VKAYARVNDDSQDVGPEYVPATNLDRNHRKRKDVGFLAICSSAVQNLWCNPSCTGTMLDRSVSYGIQVLSDRGETKISDPCTTGGVYDYI